MEQKDEDVEHFTHYTQFESQVQAHEYYDYSLDGKNLCAMGAVVGILIFCVLFYLPSTTTSIIVFFAAVGALFCCLRGNPKLRMMSMVHQARGEVVKEAVESLRERELNENNTPPRDWTKAAGVYSPTDSNKAVQAQPEFHSGTEVKPNPTKLELHFTVFCNKRGLWNVTGESLDGRFTILHGLLADTTGKIYWVEQHPNPNGQRTILVEGYINYDTFQFMGGTWKDNLGCGGVHSNLYRGPSADSASV